MTRIAIIGAGPSGLSALRAFARARDTGAAVPEIVCFEKQADWGGLWACTWRTGLDQNGEPVHSSMYRYLWSNGPKECLEFADYSFEAHFGQPIPSFPPRAVLHDYIVGRAAASGVRDWIRFDTAVRRIEPDGDGFLVTAEDLKARSSATERFDRVIVATGHFSVPNVPEFPGLPDFPGRVLHAHDFRDARNFTGLDLLIVGASYSAEDIGLQCWKYGAKSVTMTWRTAAMGFDWPDTMEERPLLTRFEDDVAQFSDGTSKRVDAVILCTGYQHHFPFMADALRLRTTNRLYAPGLYKGVAWAAHPGVFYLGMQDQWYTFTMFDAEAWWARDVILGRITLPDAPAMAADMTAWAAREAAADDAYKAIQFQADYVAELAAATDYPDFDLAATVACFKAWKKDKQVSITGYRDKAFRSPVTGTMSPLHHTPWVEAMDDSIAAFMGVKSAAE